MQMSWLRRWKRAVLRHTLVNTGWNGTGKRISIKDTCGIIDAILSGDILKAPTKKIPHFDFEVPTELPGVDPAILDPRGHLRRCMEWEKKAEDLAGRFIKNFAKYESNEAGKALWQISVHRNNNRTKKIGCIFTSDIHPMPLVDRKVTQEENAVVILGYL